MSKVFISYSRGDSVFVDRLEAELKGRGYDVWVDRLDIGGGAIWRTEIAYAIRGCDAFLLVFSPRAAKSANVSKELAIADQYGKAIYPVFLEKYPIPESMEYPLAGLQQIPFSADGFADGLPRLLRVLPPPIGGAVRDSDREFKPPTRLEIFRTKRRVLISAALIGGFVTISILAITVLPDLLSVGSAIEQPGRREAQSPDSPSLEYGDFSMGSVDKNTHDSAIEMMVYDRPGIYSIEIPADWLYSDFSNFTRTFERFSAPSGQHWVEVEVGPLGVAPPEGVLERYEEKWHTEGFLFSEINRKEVIDGWLIEGHLINAAKSVQQVVYLLLRMEVRGNANLVFYSLDGADPKKRDRLFEGIRLSFVSAKDTY